MWKVLSELAEHDGLNNKSKRKPADRQEAGATILARSEIAPSAQPSTRDAQSPKNRKEKVGSSLNQRRQEIRGHKSFLNADMSLPSSLHGVACLSVQTRVIYSGCKLLRSGYVERQLGAEVTGCFFLLHPSSCIVFCPKAGAISRCCNLQCQSYSKQPPWRSKMLHVGQPNKSRRKTENSSVQ